MISPAQFRLDFPEFADTAAFPDSGVSYWLNVAGLMLFRDRWGASAADPWPSSNPPARKLYDVGCELFIAHNLALERQAQKTAANGAAPGISSGPVSSKSVDKVSVSYDTQGGITPGDGHWNLTIYGTRLMNLVRVVGAGPLHVGFSPNMPLGAQAWPGPY